MFVRKGGASPRPPFYRRTPCSRRRGGRPCPPKHSVSGGLFVGGDAHIAPYATAAPWHKASLCEGGVMAFGHDGGREKRETGGAEPSAPTLLLPRAYALSVRGDAPQGYLFRFAPLRGHRPLQNHRRRVCIYSGRTESSAPTHHPSLPSKKEPPCGGSFLLCLIPRRRGRPPPALRLPRPPAWAAPSRGRTPPPRAARAGSPPPPRGQAPPPACDRPSGPHRRG